MEYTIEEIYKLAGKNDYVATMTFKQDSEAFQKYGDMLTVQFVYDQFEREKLDNLIETGNSSTHGRVKAKDLIYQLTEDENKQLIKEGINSLDIFDILAVPSTLNTFHSRGKKALNKLTIEFNPLPKGEDLGWMFGFYQRLVNQNIGLSPQERFFYLAGKLLLEPQYLSGQEKQEIFDKNGLMKKSVEFEFLKMKEMCKILDDNELQNLNRFKKIHFDCCKRKLDKYLTEAGSSFKKLSDKNIEQATVILDKVFRFNERRLNIMGKHPIYIDIDSFLHIYMRHVEEFKVNKHFEHKDNFLWNEEDIFSVMKNVIEQIEDEYQIFRETNPNTKYSKYGQQSLYFQGDYYTFHVEPNGRISTFYKNRKEYEQVKE